MMTRILLTGAILLAALVPVAPLLLLAFVVIAAVVATAPVARLTRSAVAVERRLALHSVEQFRGPPARLARF